MSDGSYLAYGRHVIVDIAETPAAILDDMDRLEQALVSAAVAEGVTVLGTLKHAFNPSGVTILLLLAESHVSLHTYPEEGKAFFDAFTCGARHEPLRLFRRFAAMTAVRGYKILRCERGG
ncbi:adenosylmethionine decarboxylase [Trinickia sp. EG282A]|uniref:adenosylmethionine decarboxylase n=1 Tax=Trinickia sp. EG282A TaxID=3237013 RepID=UPI0034D30F67